MIGFSKQMAPRLAASGNPHFNAQRRRELAIMLAVCSGGQGQPSVCLMFGSSFAAISSSLGILFPVTWHLSTMRVPVSVDEVLARHSSGDLRHGSTSGFSVNPRLHATGRLALGLTASLAHPVLEVVAAGGWSPVP